MFTHAQPSPAKEVQLPADFCVEHTSNGQFVEPASHVQKFALGQHKSSACSEVLPMHRGWWRHSGVVGDSDGDADGEVDGEREGIVLGEGVGLRVGMHAAPLEVKPVPGFGALSSGQLSQAPASSFPMAPPGF